MEIEDLFQSLAVEARELYLSCEVPVLCSPPSPLQFYRQWVSYNRPVVIQNAISHWPALERWTSNDYLRSHIGDHDVTVAVTPNGYADAIYQNKFVMPEERKMKFGHFLDVLEEPSETNGIFYVQKQNSNFTDEFRELMSDAETDLSWATEAFGQPPDAVNFWIGDERAVTSMHKDHYENIYCVIRGHKTFTLHPPTDQPFIPYEEFQSAVYKQREDGEFDVIDDHDTGMVPWIAVDPLKPDLVRYPEYSHARSITVSVGAGETLYLPSLWYHHVQQSHGCIAVNYWYDMEYDIKYNYYKFVESFVKRHRGQKNTAEQPTDSGES